MNARHTTIPEKGVVHDGEIKRLVSEIMGQGYSNQAFADNKVFAADVELTEEYQSDPVALVEQVKYRLQAERLEGRDFTIVLFDNRGEIPSGLDQYARVVLVVHGGKVSST